MRDFVAHTLSKVVRALRGKVVRAISLSSNSSRRTNSVSNGILRYQRGHSVLRCGIIVWMDCVGSP
jgi:hypothetical protein